MEYLNKHNKIEYGDNSKSIFSGGLNTQTIIKDNYIVSNISPNEEFDRFKDLYVPIGLQRTKYKISTCKPNIVHNDKFLSENIYDKLLENVNSKVKIPKNKTKKKKSKKNQSRKK